eukprot:Gb_29242 [translate_table: standard]
MQIGARIFGIKGNRLEDNVGFSLMQRMWKSSKNRAKKKIYHREHELNHAVDLQKKPNVVLQLKDILMKQKGESMLLRDLEKEVGLIRKWNYMAAIEKYPRIFKVSGGNRRPPVLELTDEAKLILKDEGKVWKQMEPVIVDNLRKLLMMTIERRVALEKIEQIKKELGLPDDFTESLIPQYPQFFKLEEISGVSYLVLGQWDSSLAITARELTVGKNGVPLTRKSQIPRDGNFIGPYAFKIKYPASFKPLRRHLEEMAKWQNMAFLSPYMHAKELDPRSPQAQKRAVAVLHEILSLTLEKRLTATKLDIFHAECKLPCRLLACIVRHNGIFYMTNKGAHTTVFLKEAYEGHNLIDKCPLMRFNDRFLELMGRRDLSPKWARAFIVL